MAQSRSLSEKVQELSFKLECALQQVDIMKLEKIEYEKELDQIKHQNQTLLQETQEFINDSYPFTESSQENFSPLPVFLEHISDYRDCNIDLNTQISDCKKRVNELQNKNTLLQKQNQNYQKALETLTQKSQKCENMHRNDTLQLENTVKRLQNECDVLRQQIVSDSSSEEKHSESAEFLTNKNDSDIYDTTHDNCNISWLTCKSNSRRNSDFSHYESNDETQFFELKMENDTMDTLLAYYSEDCIYILNQLQEFGYNEREIINAITNIRNKGQIIENESENDCDCWLDIAIQIQEIDRLTRMNNDNKTVIGTLRRQMRSAESHARQNSLGANINTKSCWNLF